MRVILPLAMAAAEVAAVAVEKRASQSFSCSTWYANRPRSSVHTQYNTDTEYHDTSTYISSTYTNPSYTHIIYPSTVSTTKTITHTFTYYSTVASTTVTKAAEKGYIPLTSAKTTSIPSPVDKAKRAEDTNAVSSTTKSSATPSSSTGYPLEVFCWTTVSPYYTITYQPVKDQTGTVTSTVTTPSTTHHKHTVVIKKTSTVSTATATVFAECKDPKNVLSSFGGNPLYDAVPGYYEWAQVSDVPGDNPYVRAALQSPEDCCAAAYANGFSGFQYGGAVGRDAACQVPVWDSNFGRGFTFYTNDADYVDSSNEIWLGNLGPNDVDTQFAGNCLAALSLSGCWTDNQS